MNFLNFLNQIFDQINFSKIFLIIKIFFIVLNLFLLFFLIRALLNVKKILPAYNKIKVKKLKKIPLINKEILKDYLIDVFKKLKSDSIILKKIAFKELDNLLIDLFSRLDIQGGNLKEKFINLLILNNIEVKDFFKVEEIKIKILNGFNYYNVDDSDLDFVISFYINLFKKINILDKDEFINY